MDESGRNLGKGKEKTPMAKPELSAKEAGELAERTQRVPGTENYRLPDGARGGGIHAIEQMGILGHDNLETKTEIEKAAEDQAGGLEDHFSPNPDRLD